MLTFSAFKITDGAYRLFYGKAGTRTLLLWSERSLRGRYQTLTVPDLLDTLIPMNKGKNAELSIAKYTARIALFDSQTIAISAPENIAWGKYLFNRKGRALLNRHICSP